MKISKFICVIIVIIKSLVLHSYNQSNPAVKSLNKPDFLGQRVLSTNSADGLSYADLNLKGTVNFFYGDHVNFFSKSPLDQQFYISSSWDAVFDTSLQDVVSSRVAVRTKALWGDETSIIATTTSRFKIGDAVTGAHNHYIPRLVPWVREAWIDFSVNEALSMDDDVQHRIKMGAFPFSVGRGISLGSAYVASQGFLGFCSTNIIDQFAFGTLLSGDIIKNQLAYNSYVAILENFSDSALRVNESVYGNQVGRRDSPERGFGVINFVVAFNTKWRPLNHPGWHGSFEIEPYVLYNHSPEQLVEARGSASSRLGTFGLAMEYVGSRFEWGVETAFNCGTQQVRALDRNQIQTFVDDNGIVGNQYTFIQIGAPDSGQLAVETSALKAYLAGPGSGQGVALNGQLIGTLNETVCCVSTPVSYYNDYHRFRGAYTNKFKGMMLVTDASWSVLENKTLQLVCTAAWATGDINPNVNLSDPSDSQPDGDYQGFIGLQEIYAGKRIESLFLIGNNSFVRPLSTPSFITTPDSESGIVSPSRIGFASQVGGFTNIAFIGGGVDYKTRVMRKKWRVRPSVLSYWQDRATKAYDNAAELSLDVPAHKHLGVEINTTVKVDLVGELSGYFIGGIFIPGNHYQDVLETPLDDAQKAELKKRDSTGLLQDNFPTLGSATAIALNWGLDFCF